MHALICGSVAYDTIMVFPGRFQDHILPDQIHILNISFPVPEMRREFGGCAGNIAYNLKLLGGNPLVMATVGEDAQPYLDRMDQLGLPRQHVRQVPGTFTAQAFITTDLDSNQITAFHPGAMSFSHLNKVQEARDVSIGLVAPDGREGMLQHARDLAAAGIPFIFDPGQSLPLFNGDELLEFLALADYACFNDYEAKLTCERTGRSLDQLCEGLQAVVITRGANGSEIRTPEQSFVIPVVPVDATIDPTGCGDAYRAGLLYGLMNGLGWEKTGRLAALMGACKIEKRGTQNHAPTREQIALKYFQCFKESIW